MNQFSCGEISRARNVEIWGDQRRIFRREGDTSVRVTCRSGLQRVVWGERCDDFIGAVICVRCRMIDLSLAGLDRVFGGEAVMTWSIRQVALSGISSGWVLWAPILGFPNRSNNQKWVGWQFHRRFHHTGLSVQRTKLDRTTRQASDQAASVAWVGTEVAANETGTIGQAGGRSKDVRLPLLLVIPRIPPPVLSLR